MDHTYIRMYFEVLYQNPDLCDIGSTKTSIAVMNPKIRIGVISECQNQFFLISSNKSLMKIGYPKSSPDPNHDPNLES
jgi:hypothetical protein